MSYAPISHLSQRQNRSMIQQKEIGEAVMSHPANLSRSERNELMISAIMFSSAGAFLTFLIVNFGIYFKA